MSFERLLLPALAFAAALVGSSMASPPPVPAQTALLRLDPRATHIAFRLPGGLHDTHGTFRLEEGMIEVDTATNAASGMVIVDAASGETGNASRDKRMREVVLEAARYPDIRFRPSAVRGSFDPDGSFRAIVEGTFTLHGADHALTLAVEGRLSGERATATCRFAVPYVEWGLEDPSVLFLTVAKQVEVEVTAEADVTWKTPGLG